MKVSKKSVYVGPEKTDPDNWAKDVNDDLTNIFLCLGRIRFGPNNNVINKGENVQGQFITYTTNASANTEDTVSHNLASIPVGYLIVKQNKAGSIYDSGTSWTSSHLYLKGSASSMTVTIFLLQ